MHPGSTKRPDFDLRASLVPGATIEFTRRTGERFRRVAEVEALQIELVGMGRLAGGRSFSREDWRRGSNLALDGDAPGYPDLDGWLAGTP